MRKHFCEKDGISITYLDENVCFEDVSSAESILFSNDGSIIFNNYENDPVRVEYFTEYFHRIYPAIARMRELDALEAVA